MDGAGPFILGAMLSALVIAALAAGWWNVRWWLAGLIGTLIGEAAFLYWVPVRVWSIWAPGFLPFAALPAFVAAAIIVIVKKKVMQWRG